MFDKALKLMKTYDDSKTFIVNGDIESVVKNVNDVLKKPSPYFEIFKLPELLDKFISLYGSLLKETQKPIDIAISDARQRVFEDLKDKNATINCRINIFACSKKSVTKLIIVPISLICKISS